MARMIGRDIDYFRLKIHQKVPEIIQVAVNQAVLKVQLNG